MLASNVARILGSARWAAGVLALMLLGACGQKGPLYLPPNTPPLGALKSGRDVPPPPPPVTFPDPADNYVAPATQK